MQGWDGQANWNRDVLERIVALLFALANLAELAAGAPFLRRRQVLGILGYAEAEARAFVIGMSTGAAISADALEQAHDVARLAASFRALALALCAMLAHGALFATHAVDGPRACRPWRRISRPAARWLDTPAPPAFDTS